MSQHKREEWQKLQEEVLARSPGTGGLTLENLREEVAGRPLNICYPPGDARPWSADNLRYQLRKHDEIAKLAARVGAAAQSQEGGK